MEAPPSLAVGFLIGAGPAADQISRDGLRPIANRRISVARVARWRCSSGLGLHGCSWGIGDAGWAYLFRHKADGSRGQTSSQRWHSSALPLGPSKGYSPPPKNTNTELSPTHPKAPQKEEADRRRYDPPTDGSRCSLSSRTLYPLTPAASPFQCTMSIVTSIPGRSEREMERRISSTAKSWRYFDVYSAA